MLSKMISKLSSRIIVKYVVPDYIIDVIKYDVKDIIKNNVKDIIKNNSQRCRP